MTVQKAATTAGVRTLLSTCPRDCYDACGLQVLTENGRIKQVRGDPQHHVSRGKLCRKCSIGYNSIWLDPEARITRPLRRTGRKGEGSFAAVTWDDAISDIAERFQAIVSESGADKIINTHYTGTFAAIGYHFPMRFFNRLGATEVNPDSVCNLAGHIALGYVYGDSMTGFDPRTAKDSRCIMVWGANPSTAAPHTDAQWLRESPARRIVIDPIRTSTAASADLHLQLFPGSDAALAFALMHVMERDRLIDRGFIEAHTIGWEQLQARLENTSPEWAETITGVPAADILQAAHMFADGPSLLWLGQGFQRQPRGGNAMRACALLPALSGNLAKPGAGFLYLNGLGQRHIDDTWLLGTHLRQHEVADISQMDLAEHLEDPARSQALFCWNNNIAASNPQQSRLHQALQREDLFTVVAEVFPTDSTDYADYVLPAASFLESDDLFASYFDLTLSAQVKATEPLGEALPNSEIFRRLSRAMGYTEPELYESDPSLIDNLLQQSGLEESFASLSQKGTVPIAPDPVIQFASLEFATPSGKIEMASATAQAEAQTLLPEPHADERPRKDRLRLLSPASPWAINDTFSNDEKIEKQAGPSCVYLHPDDAAERGLVDAQQVRLVNDTGELGLMLKLSLDVPRGVALSHKGRWPKRQPGKANVNVLNPGDRSDLGGATCVHAVEVEVLPG